MGHSPNGNYSHAVLTNRAMTTPDKVALTHVRHGDVTYGELQERVNRRANALRSTGIEPGTRVACLTHDQLATVEVYLAIARIGAVVVAVNTFWADETMNALLERARCEAFVYDAKCQDQVDRVGARSRTISTWIRIGGPADGALDLDALTAGASAAPPAPGGSWDDPVLLSFTSGTTGLPKAVTHTHASCIANSRPWADVPRGEDPIQYGGASIVGIVFTSVVGPALWGGVRLILEEDGGPGEFIAATERYKVTHLAMVSSYVTAALQSAPESADLSSLRVILLGGEPVTRSALELIYGRLPDVEVYSFYGQSEAPYSCIMHTPLDADAPGLVPQTGFSVMVVDSSGNRVVGEVGEICLGGPHVFSGYDSQPEKTAEVLRDGWYVGGDLGLMDADGRLTVYGRREDALVREGRFVLPSEVEEFAVDLPSVREAGAVAIGEINGQRILLAVVLHPGTDAMPDELLEQLRDRVPATHLPDAVVVVDELPYSTNIAGRGKLLRREIATRWGTGVANA